MKEQKDYNSHNKSIINLKENAFQPNIKKGLCSTSQLLAIFIPLLLLGLFCAFYIPIYLKNHKREVKIIYLTNNNSTNNNSTNNTIRAKEEYEYNYTYATLTPKNGYNNIFIFLGGISEVANKYFEFFQSNKSIIPVKTKIYFLAGKIRKIKFLEQHGITKPSPGWFNVDSVGNLICDNCTSVFDDAKESLYLILDTIDQISKEEIIDYKKIFLGGFNQGAIMTNYVLLNSRHELGGYLAFSGYILDHNFPYNYIVTTLNDVQKQVLASKKNYHILATHSFNDQVVPYVNSIEAYYKYFCEYTNFKIYNFGALNHEFVSQPVLHLIRIWLKERMGK